MNTLQSRLWMGIAAAATCLGCAPTGTQTMAPDTTPGAGQSNPAVASITDSVLDDAARQTGVARSALAVQSSESVVWSDGSLGCPMLDMMYTQALVPGYRIKVLAGDRVLDYHASARGIFVLCPPERSIEPVNDAIR